MEHLFQSLISSIASAENYRRNTRVTNHTKLASMEDTAVTANTPDLLIPSAGSTAVAAPSPGRNFFAKHKPSPQPDVDNDEEAICNEMISRAIEEVLSTSDTTQEENKQPEPPAEVVPEDVEVSDLEPFDVLVSFAQNMATSQHAGNKLLMTFCYQAAPHFARCHDEREKLSMAEQLVNKMQDDLGTRFLWESSHLPTPVELAITAICILIDLMPTQHDVVFTSSGSLVPEHTGNEFFIMLCQALLIRLDDVNNVVTFDFITDEMGRLRPPGRFLLADSSEFKFTPLNNDQLQCFIMRQIMEEDRNNYRRVVASAVNPNICLEKASVLTRGSKRCTPTPEYTLGLEAQERMRRTNKRNRLPHVAHKHNTRTIAKKIDQGAASESSDDDLSESDPKEQKIKRIILGKRQRKPTLKAAAADAIVDFDTKTTTKTTTSPSTTRQAVKLKRPAATTKAIIENGFIAPQPKAVSSPKGPKLVSKPKVVLPTSKRASLTGVKRKKGIRVIYPTTPHGTNADNPADESQAATTSMKSNAPGHAIPNHVLMTSPEATFPDKEGSTTSPKSSVQPSSKPAAPMNPSNIKQRATDRPEVIVPASPMQKAVATNGPITGVPAVGVIPASAAKPFPSSMMSPKPGSATHTSPNLATTAQTTHKEWAFRQVQLHFLRQRQVPEPALHKK